MRDYGASTYFLVKLFNKIDGNEVLFTSSRLSCLHDAHELIQWLACQIQGKIPYQISEVTSIDGIIHSIDYPRSVQKHIYCKHYPFKPLFLDVKRKRRSEREKLGLYYEF